MKYAFIVIMALAEIALIIWYCITGFSIFLIGMFLFGLLCLFTWYKDSQITFEWRVFYSKCFPSFNFQPKYFTGKQHYYFICEKFERVKSESRIHKIVGFSKGYHHKNSIRIGYRRSCDVLYPVLYIYSDWKRTAVNMGVTFRENELMYVEFEVNDGVLTTYIRNVEKDVYQYSKHPIGFKFGLGYQLYPYGCCSKWLIRK